jgi:spore coat polysaccharide biosynthesis protein SpsF
MPGDRKQVLPGAIILARMDSVRLPGKVLADLGGIPVLDHVLARLPADHLAGTVLATTDRAIDDPLERFAQSRQIGLYRGSKSDVAGRFAEAARAHGFEAAFRVNGDSPFLDAGLFREALAVYAAGRFALVTNIAPRSYPYGVSVELVRIDSLVAALAGTADPQDQEHVTRALYRLPPETIGRIAPGPGLADESLTRIRLTIDTPDDLDTARRLAARHGGRFDSLTYKDALASGLYAPVEALGRA